MCSQKGLKALKMTFAHINPVLKDGANKLIFFVLAPTFMSGVKTPNYFSKPFRAF